MKKCVLSAAVLAMLVPAIYAMDGAAEPVVEVEVPAVETQVEAEVEVPAVEAGTDEVQPVDVGGEEVKLEVAVCDLLPVDPVVEVDGTVEKVTTDEMVEFRTMEVEGEVNADGPKVVACFGDDPNLVDLASQSGIAEGDGTGEPVHPIFYSFGAPAGAVDDAQPVEGGAVDPNVVDLAAQSGVAVDDPAITARGGDGEIQPYYRSLSGDGEQVHVMNFAAGGLAPGAADNAAPVSASNLAEPQLLNDEQRGAVRGLRSEEESTKSRSGLGKFMAKFRKPKSEVTQASATVTDKSLSSKLAEVDRMRDTALRTGDQKALAKADKLEKELRAKAGTATRIPTRTK